MEHTYIARQPILDKNLDIFAYEILYRDATQVANIDNDRHASAAVISSILNKFGTKKLLGSKRAFVKVDEKFLLSDLIFSVPKDFFVFSVFESVPMSEKVEERLEQLHTAGYILSIDNTLLSEAFFIKYASVLQYFTYCKIFITPSIEKFIHFLSKKGLKLIAAQIEDRITFQEASALGCDAYEGYFFAKPKIMENRENNPSRMAVLSLYNMLMEDRSIDELAVAFENNPDITVELLQFINSAAFHFRDKISSIRHVIVLIGRIELAKWLMLMIYSKSVSATTRLSPLLLMVKNRTELMERIVRAIYPNADAEMLSEAYMVAVLSLIDTLFEMPLEEILQNINVSDEVKAALIRDEGFFGDIYSVVRSVEQMDIDAIVSFEIEHNMKRNHLKNIILDAIEEVTKLEEPTVNEAS
jgi:EAL and modified HD-GYP domain-containing signal transduction protein